MPLRRFGTYREIDLLSRWIAANPPIHSVLIISSATHLRRIRLCCRSLLGPGLQLAFLAAPNLSPEHAQGSPLLSVSEPLLEVLKLLIYCVGLKTGSMRFFSGVAE